MFRMRLQKILFLALLWLIPANVVATETQSTNSLIAFGGRVASDDARGRLVIDFNRKPEFTLHYTANPNRIVIDLAETHFAFSETELEPIGLFGDIRYGTMGENASRIVLTMSRPAKAVLAEVQPNESSQGFRLVIDCEVVPQKDYATLVETQAWTGRESVVEGKGDRVGNVTPAPEGGDYLIAVDAGHGGIDAGARGALTKVDEKEVTLAFAKDLADRLNAIKGVRAFLTREDDTFISLSERVVIARQRQAKLFISLHADTLRQKDIRGATVYTISDKASDLLAAGLAERENLSDDIAGIQVTDEPEEVTDILIDLTRRETQAFSIRMAESVVKSFEGQITLINNPLRHAGFRVLQAPDVPSILLELGFLSNPEDEKLLTDPEWRAKVATLLSDAVGRYLKESGVAVAN
ncbi:MAG: hypothetical protein RLZZ444_4636 [Pseudomonadota bacterium]